MVIMALVAAAQATPAYVERPGSSFDSPLIVFACSDASNVRRNPKLLIGAARLDGHNVVRLGGQQPGWWLNQSQRLVDAISYYGSQVTARGRNLMIRAAGQAFGHSVNVEFTIHLPNRGEPSGTIIVREDGVEHRGACVPFVGGQGR